MGWTRTLALDDGQVVQCWAPRWMDRRLLFISDVTARQNVEQGTRRLLSDLSHELRTPLATLLTHIEVLQLPNLSSEMGAESLRFMKDEVQRLVRLADNAVELGRLEATEIDEMHNVDLFSLVDDVVRQMLPIALEQRIELTLKSETPLRTVVGDPDRLKEVFLNLLDNALKYSRVDTSVIVELHNGDNVVNCSVSDSGPGIDAEHRPNVTRRFYRGVASGIAGSGLGLAMVSEILRRHRSRLVIESRTADEVRTGEQTGTCMRFSLPTVGGDG